MVGQSEATDPKEPASTAPPRDGGNRTSTGRWQRLEPVRLYVLIGGCSSAERFAELVKTLVNAGVHAIQLREKRLEDRDILQRAQLLHRLTSGTGILSIINDRPDIAMASRADGVHLGQEDLPVSIARDLVGPGCLIGVSTHSIDQARQAVRDGADYIGCGPTFHSQTKQFEHFAGLELLRAVGREIQAPAFAIGGISRQNVQRVIDAGFKRIALSGAVVNATDPAEEVRTLLRHIGAALG